MTMTRADAIDHIMGLEASVASQFYINVAEYEAGERETREALNALGVTDAEIDGPLRESRGPDE